MNALVSRTEAIHAWIAELISKPDGSAFPRTHALDQRVFLAMIRPAATAPMSASDVLMSIREPDMR